jgi:hypothetical protein
MKSYAYAVLLILGVLITLSGVLWLRAAVTLEQHIGGLSLVGVGAALLFGAYKLKPSETRADLAALGQCLGPSKVGRADKTSQGDGNAI